MSRGPYIFRQTDLMRAIKAARAAGEEHFRVEINRDGNLNVICGKQMVDSGPIQPDASEDVDRWLRENNAHHPEKA